MTDRYALYSNRVWLEERLQPAAIFVQDGFIQRIEKGPKTSGPIRVVDLKNAVIMPGLIDVHVHINEPGRTHWEGFDTATRAAAAGGITTLVDMPLNSNPVTTTRNHFEQKINAIGENLHVHCGFWGGLVPESINELEALMQSGVLGIKVFLTHSGIGEFPNVTEKDLHQALPIIAKKGIPLLAHCELDQRHPGERDLIEHPGSYRAYLASRPPSWENEAVRLMIRLCRKYNCRTHIVHLSSAEAIPDIQAAKEAGLPLTVETCPHYLYWEAEQIPDGDPRFKCAPPIRSKANNKRLWRALQQGIIDFIASDHSPAPPEKKQIESGNLAAAWGGIASLQFLLPIIWTKAREMGFTFKDVVKWLSKGPAEFVGLQDKKGAIEEGCDADLCIWEPEAPFMVEEKNTFHRHKVSPYLGETLYGKVVQTYVKGVKVFENGKMTALGRGEIQLK